MPHAAKPLVAWTALPPGADPSARIGQLRRAYDSFVSTGCLPGDTGMRSVVAASWQRSARAHVDPDATAPINLADDALEQYRSHHPLAVVMPVVRELVGDIARDSGHLLAVCDAAGRLLWVEGHPGARRRADRMNFVAGAAWSERDAGTNAPGTAVAVDHAVQIFAAEHFSSRVQTWTCAAAPIHDPRTGLLLGAVDITGGDSLAHPHSLAFVQAVARAAEAHLAMLGTAAPPALAVVSAYRAALQLSALGRDEALVAGVCSAAGTADTPSSIGLGTDAATATATGIGPAPIRLSRRHSEIVALLAAHPDGMTGDELALALYEDEFTNPVTLRAELSRLRHILGRDQHGAELLDSRPYRLRAPMSADFLTVERFIDAGALSAALAAYSGPLLPSSQAPAIVRIRRRLDAALRAMLTTARDPELLAAWTRTPWGVDDVAAWQALAASLPPGTPRRAAALARAAEIDLAYGATSAQPPRA